jgi:hypothetical protein
MFLEAVVVRVLAVAATDALGSPSGMAEDPRGFGGLGAS